MHTIPKSGVPFSQADNPVMSVVASLASAVSPAVAAAATQSRALGELTEFNRDGSEGCCIGRGQYRLPFEKAAAVALGAAAAKAHVLASVEEAGVIEAQLRKMESLRTLLEAERRPLYINRLVAVQQQLGMSVSPGQGSVVREAVLPTTTGGAG
ncbi:hypothetical protein V8E36_007517, partial [Tilletia maclaganii]